MTGRTKMREDLDKALVERFPKLFRDRYAPMSETCMCWGFEHDDGWFSIISTLCANIQHHIDWQRKQRVGVLLYNRALSRAIKGDYGPASRLSAWQQTQIDEALEDPEPQLRTVPAAVHQVVVRQVKEKFGTLRFYYDGGDDKIDGMVRMAESMSAVICEQCGAPGTVGGSRWISTLCETHRAEHEAKYAKDRSVS